MIFYAWGEPVWVSILAVSALVDYYNGRVIEKHPEGWQAKLALAWSLIFNLGLLFGFKYTGFFVENLNNAAGLNIPVPHIKLPIGISFYTFQTISYTIDCYWGKVKPQKSFLKFLMYVSLFPQLVAGPIVRYSVIDRRRRIYRSKSCQKTACRCSECNNHWYRQCERLL